MSKVDDKNLIRALELDDENLIRVLELRLQLIEKHSTKVASWSKWLGVLGIALVMFCSSLLFSLIPYPELFAIVREQPVAASFLALFLLLIALVTWFVMWDSEQISEQGEQLRLRAVNLAKQMSSENDIAST